MICSCALQVGRAVRAVFPKETYFGISSDPFGFACTFTYAGKFDASLLSLIESKVQQEPIQEMEMLASNAKEFFRHLGLEKLAEKAEGMEGLVQIARLGDFADFYEGELGEWEAFALLGFKQKKDKVCIFGRAFSTRDEKKVFLKKYKDYPTKRSGEHYSEELELFEGPFWHPRGMILVHILQAYWRKCLESDGFEEVSIGEESPKDYFKAAKLERFGYWIGMRDHLYDHKKRDLKDLICSSMEVFDFKSKWHDGQLYVEDGLGRQWPLGKMTLFGELRRFIFLLLEKYSGELPFWLCPEQFRVFILDKVDPTPVIKILEKHDCRYKLEDINEGLGEKLHRALRIKVPYVIFFGKREEAAKSVTIRPLGLQQDDTMTYEKFETFIEER